jgi:hypothetical protein
MTARIDCAECFGTSARANEPPCFRCNGTGAEPCAYCPPSAGKQAAAIVDGQPCCADCVALSASDTIPAPPPTLTELWGEPTELDAREIDDDETQRMVGLAASLELVEDARAVGVPVHEAFRIARKAVGR